MKCMHFAYGLGVSPFPRCRTNICGTNLPPCLPQSMEISFANLRLMAGSVKCLRSASVLASGTLCGGPMGHTRGESAQRFPQPAPEKMAIASPAHPWFLAPRGLCCSSGPAAEGSSAPGGEAWPKRPRKIGHSSLCPPVVFGPPGALLQLWPRRQRAALRREENCWWTMFECAVVVVGSCA